MRAQKMKDAAMQAASSTMPPPPSPSRMSQRAAEILGPVSAEENKLVYADRSIPLPTVAAAITRDRSLPEDAPEALRPLIESTKRKKRKKPASDEPVSYGSATDETVEEIVPPVAADAYDQVSSIRRHIALDRSALRTFIVTRELLGPPRAKQPHRPGMRSK